MHPSILLPKKILFSPVGDFCCYVLTESKLYFVQCHLITNTVWWQNFHCRTSPDHSALFGAVEETKSDFAAQLVSFIGYLINEVPSQAYWINEIAKYDFEGAGAYLVASVPGLYVQTAKSFLFGAQLLPFSKSNFTDTLHNILLFTEAPSIRIIKHINCLLLNI